MEGIYCDICRGISFSSAIETEVKRVCPYCERQKIFHGLPWDEVVYLEDIVISRHELEGLMMDLKVLILAINNPSERRNCRIMGFHLRKESKRVYNQKGMIRLSNLVFPGWYLKHLISDIDCYLPKVPPSIKLEFVERLEGRLERLMETKKVAASRV